MGSYVNDKTEQQGGVGGERMQASYVSVIPGYPSSKARMWRGKVARGLR